MMRFVFTFFASAAIVAFAGLKVCVPPNGIAKKQPKLLEQWNNQQYGLDDDETLRFIPQPLGKGQFSWSVEGGYVDQFKSSNGDGDVRSAIRICGWTDRYSLKEPDCVVDAGLASIPARGDWMVRTNAPVHRRMKALQSILSHSTGRNLIFERLPATRDVIVISGKWGFRPIDFSSFLSRTVYLYTDDSKLQRDGFPRSWQGTEHFLRRLQGFSDCYVIDETNGQIPSFIQWRDDLPMRCVRWDGQLNPDIDPLLDNRIAQTSLQFTLTTRQVPVWFVEERRQK